MKPLLMAWAWCLVAASAIAAAPEPETFDAEAYKQCYELPDASSNAACLAKEMDKADRLLRLITNDFINDLLTALKLNPEQEKIYKHRLAIVRTNVIDFKAYRQQVADMKSMLLDDTEPATGVAHMSVLIDATLKQIDYMLNACMAKDAERPTRYFPLKANWCSAFDPT